jgi:general secretion pathway protein I
MKRPLTRPNGFTLIETLGAFAIVAISLIALFEATSGSSKSVAVSDFDQTALRLGQSLLAVAGVTEPLKLGTTEGRFDDGFRWTKVVEQYEVGRSAGADRQPVSGAWVSIEIQSPRGGQGQERSLVLTSLRLLDRDGKTLEVGR